MPSSFAVLFALLIAVPGLLIPLYLSVRMYRVLADDRRPTPDKLSAGGGMVGMLLLMGLAAYLALEAYARLSALAGAAS